MPYFQVRFGLASKVVGVVYGATIEEWNSYDGWQADREYSAEDVAVVE